MGTDIKLAIEYYTSYNGVKKWYNIDSFIVDYYSNEFEHSPLFRERDYDLFAALADVRNRGFVIPMSQPRGLPDDLHEVTKRIFKEYSNGFIHSHCTLKELIDYSEKHGTKKQSGLIKAEVAKLLDEKGVIPDEWCQGSTDETMVYREWVRSESPVSRLITAVKYYIRKFYVSEDYYENIRLIYSFD